MSSYPTSAAPEVDRDSGEKARRREYSAAFRTFSRGLGPQVRAKINGSAQADWQSPRTFALPVNADSPAYRTEEGDPIADTMNELAGLRGALPRMALWLSDRLNGAAGAAVAAGEGGGESGYGAVGAALGATAAVGAFRIAVARICEAKNSRLEAHLISLAIGLNLHGNANGYEIAGHFGLTPQTVHEMLGDTCTALGMPKPLAKANKAKYARTQYRHNLRRTA